LCTIRPTRSSTFMPRVLASSALRPSTFIWAMVRFSVTLRWGNSSKCWNTLPTLARSCGRLVLGSCRLMPSIRMLPFWMGSSPLTVLMGVNLPEPEVVQHSFCHFLDH
jgi:hypothetical protein